jgi:tetratricopeptide (TPR) repeat protein
MATSWNRIGADSRRALGRNLASLGKLDEAESSLRRCLVQQPDDLRNWFEFLVLMIDSGELLIAGKVIERFPEPARNTVAFQTALARWALASGNSQAAAEAFERVLNQHPRNEKALAQIVNIARQTSRPQQERLRERLELLEEITRNRLRLHALVECN